MMSVIKLLNAVHESYGLSFVILDQDNILYISKGLDEKRIRKSRIFDYFLNHINQNSHNCVISHSSGLTYVLLYDQHDCLWIITMGLVISRHFYDYIEVPKNEQAATDRELKDYLQHLPHMDYRQFRNLYDMISFYINGCSFRYDKQELKDDHPDNPLTMMKVEQLNVNHFTDDAYHYERQLLAFVKNGDVNGLNAFLRQAKQLNVSDLAVESDSLRNVKNQLICLTTLVTRAAMSGGLDYHIAYSLSDYFINDIEAKNNINQLKPLSYQILMNFTVRLNVEDNQPHSPVISRCLDYIQIHSNESFNTKLLADDLHMSKDYLLRLFKKEMGESLLEYVQKKKVEEAKIMLQYSSMSVLEISEYLSFSSQSYFTKIFKKYTGLTPNHYLKQLKN